MAAEAVGWLVPAALLLDALVGDPAALWRRWPHPVVWIGRAIAACDGRLNRPTASTRRRRAAGALALLALALAGAGIGAGLATVCRALPGGGLVEALIASVFLAQQSLADHVLRVRTAFADGLPAARDAVGLIVGRETAALDQAGVCRAAIESCAENFSDGVVAPAFWLAVAGLPGLVVYKIVNTADSMIGHRTPRHAAFGWAAARTDDLLNIVPARLAALLLVLTAPAMGASLVAGLRTTWRDGPRHASPNAGWPESAMAALLGLALGGPRRYAGVMTEAPTLNAAGRRTAGPADIGRSLRALWIACLLEVLAYAALALV